MQEGDEHGNILPALEIAVSNPHSGLDVRDLARAGATSRALFRMARSAQQKIYERVEECLKQFIHLAMSRPPFSMSWMFMEQYAPSSSSSAPKISLLICKQTPKNKNKFKSMLIYREWCTDTSGLVPMDFVVDKVLQSVDEALDYCKRRFWPQMHKMLFIESSPYRMSKYRAEYDQLTAEMTRLLSGLVFPPGFQLLPR